uniref:HTH CENPB-type domain-containing protein n=1 Tax=Pseudonaja textilis TaxID=8673 RepID=A0A670ZE62_PSETE
MKRQAYTASFKLKVIKFAKEFGNHAAEREFGPPPDRRAIIRWRNQEEKLRKVPRMQKACRGKSAKWPHLEKELKTWIVEQRQHGVVITTKMILQEAKRIAREKEVENFTGSANWCYRFMKREKLSMRTRTRLAQRMPEDYEAKIVDFHKFIINLRKHWNYDVSQIYNMDETPHKKVICTKV